jgi:uncharacterized repeat protein (TIGR03803 family)
MKSVIRQVTLLMAALALPAGSLPAQTFTNLHSFATAAVNATTYLHTNLDGANLYAPLIVSGNTLYGVTSDDNSNGFGGVFRINTDGTGFTNLFAFATIPGGDNGAGALGMLALSGNTLYGTTRSGGTNFNGSVFAIHTDGPGFTNLHYFSALVSNTNADGAYPQAGVVLAGDRLYGTAYSGGTNGDGVIFAVNADGTGFTNLFNFNGTNGENPDAVLVASGNMLYGTTYAGGSGVNSNGTLFAINTNGTGFANYHSFSPLGSPYPTNSDGAIPQGGLVLSGSTLYGTTGLGGQTGYGYGTIFAIQTDGTGFTNIFNFNYFAGSTPYSGLLFTNNVLYGTTTSGGAHYAGTVFSVNTNGTDHTDLYDFPLANYSGTAYTNSTGAEPWSGLVFAGGALFGVTPIGGTGGVGTLYGLILPSSAPVPIPLNVQMTDGTVVLSWSDPAFSLQSAASLDGSFSNVAGAASPYNISPTNLQQFFRLQ